MNLMELLLQVDGRLRPLVGADESALQAVVDEVATGPRPTGVAPDVESRAILAGQLVSIENECRMLRESLHVELTFASRIVAHAVIGQPHPKRTPQEPQEPSEPGKPDEA